MPTQPMTLPNGMTVQVPAEWGPDEAQAWLAKQPHITKGWQNKLNSLVDQVPDFAIPGGTVSKGLFKSAVDTVAHPIENAPMLGAAAGTALLTGGASIPAQVGAAALGGATGHGVRDIVRHGMGDPRASQTPKDALQGAATSGAMEGALAGVIPMAGKTLRGLAPKIRQNAISTYARALGITPSMVKKMPVSLTPSGARMTQVDKALKIAEAGLDRGLTVNPEGFAKTQSMMDKMGAIKDYWLNQSNARFTPAKELLDPATAPVLKKTVEKFTRKFTPQAGDDALKATTEAVKKSRMLTKGKKALTLDAKTMHEFASNEAGSLGDIYGVTKSAGKELNKALATDGMNLLKSRVPDVGAPMEEQFILDKIRKGMEGSLLHGEVAKESIPGVYLAVTHPGLAAMSMVVRDPITQRRLMSASAFHKKAGSAWAKKTGAQLGGVLSKKLNLAQQGGRAMMGDSTDADKEIMDALYAQWMQGTK